MQKRHHKLLKPGICTYVVNDALLTYTLMPTSKKKIASSMYDSTYAWRDNIYSGVTRVA
jgi:hypothetical protein